MEKPMGNVLEEAKAARDAVRARPCIVQIGTQHRSEAAILLTSYGQSPGDFDFTMFVNERASGKS